MKGERESERGKSWEYDGGDEGPREGKGEKDNDEIPFSSAGPVVALGLTRLRLVENEREGGSKK